jgi:hypothetical protein
MCQIFSVNNDSRQFHIVTNIIKTIGHLFNLFCIKYRRLHFRENLAQYILECLPGKHFKAHEAPLQRSSSAPAIAATSMAGQSFHFLAIPWTGAPQSKPARPSPHAATTSLYFGWTHPAETQAIRIAEIFIKVLK